MLIDIYQLPITKKVTGIIHIGAHECEERGAYAACFGMTDENIIWIEAQPIKVTLMRDLYPQLRIFQGCISDEDDKEISFMVTNNGQSSSILNFKTHIEQHPSVVESHRITLSTMTLDTFCSRHLLDDEKMYNFLNIDIQGAELMALKGGLNTLKNIDYIYIEVNIDELYEGCGFLHEIDDLLSKNGFQRVQISMTVHGWGDAFYVRH